MTIRTSRLLAALLLALLVTPSLSAQRRFPWSGVINARSLDTLYSPDPTSARHKYRVTAWGTYSMWEDTVNSSVDPVWIYSFPPEEWAKPEWRIFDGYPIYVGDSRLLDAHGFRMNGKALPKQSLTNDHRYSAVVQGDGRPIQAMLIDWNFRGLEKRDAHDNNSGFIHFVVEEIPLTEWEICAVDSSAFPSIRLAVKVMRDSVRIEDFRSNLQLTENGIPVAIDRVDCSERTGAVSVAMVFDRSGSMDEDFGNSTRMEYTKSAGRSFVEKITAADEAAIYSFSLSTTLDQSWTSDIALLKGAIDRLQPDGWTAMNDAVLRAIDDIALRNSSRRKAVIVLSDGEDNRSQVREISRVIERARAAGVPVFTIGLLLDNDDSLRALADRTGGKYYDVRDPDAMDSVFTSIAQIVFEKGCCSIWYTTPDPRRNGTWRSVVPTFTFDGDTAGATPAGYHAPATASSSVGSIGAEVSITGVRPNPAGDGVALVYFSIVRASHVRIDVLDISGRVMMAVEDGTIDPGVHEVPISTRSLAPGQYFVRISAIGSAVVHPLVISR